MISFSLTIGLRGLTKHPDKLKPNVEAHGTFQYY